MAVLHILEHPGVGCSGYYHVNRRYRIKQGGVFVFGSNLGGRHGKGAALQAKEEFYAQPGVGEGFTGRCYAIPTKDANLNVLSLDEIAKSVSKFRWAAEISNSSGMPVWFYVTPIGTGLSGYPHEVIAPMFAGTMNCWFPNIWKPFLGDDPSIRRKPEDAS